MICHESDTDNKDNEVLQYFNCLCLNLIKLYYKLYYKILFYNIFQDFFFKPIFNTW